MSAAQFTIGLCGAAMMLNAGIIYAAAVIARAIERANGKEAE